MAKPKKKKKDLLPNISNLIESLNELNDFLITNDIGKNFGLLKTNIEEASAGLTVAVSGLVVLDQYILSNLRDLSGITFLSDTLRGLSYSLSRLATRMTKQSKLDISSITDAIMTIITSLKYISSLTKTMSADVSDSLDTLMGDGASYEALIQKEGFRSVMRSHEGNNSILYRYFLLNYIIQQVLNTNFKKGNWFQNWMFYHFTVKSNIKKMFNMLNYFQQRLRKLKNIDPSETNKLLDNVTTPVMAFLNLFTTFKQQDISLWDSLVWFRYTLWKVFRMYRMIIKKMAKIGKEYEDFIKSDYGEKIQSAITSVLSYLQLISTAKETFILSAWWQTKKIGWLLDKFLQIPGQLLLDHPNILSEVEQASDVIDKVNNICEIIESLGSLGIDAKKKQKRLKKMIRGVSSIIDTINEVAEIGVSDEAEPTLEKIENFVERVKELADKFSYKYTFKLMLKLVMLQAALLALGVIILQISLIGLSLPLVTLGCFTIWMVAYTFKTIYEMIVELSKLQDPKTTKESLLVIISMIIMGGGLITGIKAIAELNITQETFLSILKFIAASVLLVMGLSIITDIIEDSTGEGMDAKIATLMGLVVTGAEAAGLIVALQKIDKLELSEDILKKVSDFILPSILLTMGLVIISSIMEDSMDNAETAKSKLNTLMGLIVTGAETAGLIIAIQKLNEMEIKEDIIQKILCFVASSMLLVGGLIAINKMVDEYAQEASDDKDKKSKLDILLGIITAGAATGGLLLAIDTINKANFNQQTLISVAFFLGASIILLGGLILITKLVKKYGDRGGVKAKLNLLLSVIIEGAKLAGLLLAIKTIAKQNFGVNTLLGVAFFIGASVMLIGGLVLIQKMCEKANTDESLVQKVKNLVSVVLSTTGLLAALALISLAGFGPKVLFDVLIFTIASVALVGGMYLVIRILNAIETLNPGRSALTVLKLIALLLLIGAMVIIMTLISLIVAKALGPILLSLLGIMLIILGLAALAGIMALAATYFAIVFVPAVITMLLVVAFVGLMYLMVLVMCELVPLAEKVKQLRVTSAVKTIIGCAMEIIKAVTDTKVSEKSFGDVWEDDGALGVIAKILLGNTGAAIIDLFIKCIVLFFAFISIMLIYAFVWMLISFNKYYEKHKDELPEAKDATVACIQASMEIIRAIVGENTNKSSWTELFESGKGDMDGGVLKWIVDAIDPNIWSIWTLLEKVVILFLTIICLGLIWCVISLAIGIRDLINGEDLNSITTTVVAAVGACKDIITAITTSNVDKPQPGEKNNGFMDILSWLGDGVLTFVKDIVAFFDLVVMFASLTVTIMVLGMVYFTLWLAKSIAESDAVKNVDSVKNGVVAAVNSVKDIVAVCSAGDAAMEVEDDDPWYAKIGKKIWNGVSGVLGGLMDCISGIGGMAGIASSMATLGLLQVLMKQVDYVFTIIKKHKDKPSTIAGYTKNIIQGITQSAKAIQGENPNESVVALAEKSEKFKKVVDDAIRLTGRVNGLDLAKISALAQMFGNAASFSKSINGNFDKLADVINEKIQPTLEGLKEVIAAADENIKRYAELIQEAADKIPQGNTESEPESDSLLGQAVDKVQNVFGIGNDETQRPRGKTYNVNIVSVNGRSVNPRAFGM